MNTVYKPTVNKQAKESHRTGGEEISAEFSHLSITILLLLFPHSFPSGTRCEATCEWLNSIALWFCAFKKKKNKKL